MITTQTVKDKLFSVFEMGPQDASRGFTALLVGSCRCVPYLNYLAGTALHVYAIEPNNFHWDEEGNPVEILSVLTRLETDPRILQVIADSGIFIHEHYANFGMFNTAKDAAKNIYQFGMDPIMDIAIPNFHDHFILENDYAACGLECPDDYIRRGENEIEKFCWVAEASSFPEFAEVFHYGWRRIRYFWRPNHVSAKFTMFIFTQMNKRFLHLPLPDEFYLDASQYDMYAEPHTEVTQRDREGYGITW